MLWLSSMEATAHAFVEWLATRENGSVAGASRLARRVARAVRTPWLAFVNDRELSDDAPSAHRRPLRPDAALGDHGVADQPPLRASASRRSPRRWRRSLRSHSALLPHGANKALADAVRAGHATRNLAALADPPSPKAARPRCSPVWSPEELTQYLLATKSEPALPRVSCRCHDWAAARRAPRPSLVRCRLRGAAAPCRADAGRGSTQTHLRAAPRPSAAGGWWHSTREQQNC